MATSARETVGQPANPTPSATTTAGGDEVSRLQGELDQLRGDFSTLADSIKRASSQGSNAGKQYARETTEAAQRRWREQTDNIEQRIKAQPLVAVGVALGVGFVLGKLLLRR